MHRILPATVAALLLAVGPLAPAQTPPAVSGDPLAQQKDKNGEWEGEAELGINTARGNTNSDTTTARVNSRRSGKIFSLRLVGEARYVEENDATVSERYHGLVQVDGALSRGSYAFALVDGLGDRFAGFYWRYTESAGVGYKYFADRDELDLRLEAGPALRQELLTSDSRNDMTGARLRIAFRWEFLEDSTLRQNLVYTQAFDNAEEYYVSSDTAITLHLSNRLAFRTSVQVEHNNQAYPGVEPTDTWTTTSLLYSF